MRATDLRQGGIDAIPLALSALPWGFVFGLIAQPVYTLLQALLLSGYVYSGTAQLVALEQWGAALSIPTLLAAVFLVNSRYLLQGMMIAPWVRPLPFGQRYLTLFFLTDMSWALSLPRMRDPACGPGYLLGSSIVIYLAWVLGTAIGYALPLPVADPATIALDFAAAAALIGLAGSRFTGRASLLPWLVSAAVAWAAWRWLPGNAYMLAGGIAGALAGAFFGAGHRTTDPDAH